MCSAVRPKNKPNIVFSSAKISPNIVFGSAKNIPQTFCSVRPKIPLTLCSVRPKIPKHYVQEGTSPPPHKSGGSSEKGRQNDPSGQIIARAVKTSSDFEKEALDAKIITRFEKEALDAKIITRFEKEALKTQKLLPERSK